MCGVPGQTMASWAETLEEALDAGAQHMSVYPLSIEEGTPLAADVASGAMPTPDPDLAADMMLLAEKRLGEAGVARYEVANYAVPGHESRHNIAYWTGRSYAGIGPGAHGMLQPDVAQTIGLDLGEDAVAPGIARVRYANWADIDTWLTGGRFDIELLSGSEAAREDVMLGMRLSAGVRADRVAACGLEKVLEELAEAGLVEHADGRWRTTQRGWLLGNEVFGRIWAGE
jgi:oxygen-independent coproporphyrinogen-3 oxidase